MNVMSILVDRASSVILSARVHHIHTHTGRERTPAGEE